MILQTPRLLLRPYTAADWPAFRALVQDLELMKRLSGALSLEAARSLFERLLASDEAPALIGWAATMQEDGAYCGHAFLDKIDRVAGSAEIGFVLVEKFHGFGLATELCAAVLEHAHSTFGCRTVSATVDEDHEASEQVLLRAGMSLASREQDEQGAYLVYRRTW